MAKADSVIARYVKPLTMLLLQFLNAVCLKTLKVHMFTIRTSSKGHSLKDYCRPLGTVSEHTGAEVVVLLHVIDNPASKSTIREQPAVHTMRQHK